jgi:multimeric flavodoxin WrbA
LHLHRNIAETLRVHTSPGFWFDTFGGTLMPDIDVRKGMDRAEIGRDEFRARFLQHFFDPAFEPLRPELERAAEIAWEAYEDSRKAPVTRAAGPEFVDPTYRLSEDWLRSRAAIQAAARQHQDMSVPSRVLLINGSPRSDQTCPGEMSKTFRLVRAARETLASPGLEVDVLDLSRLTSEYGRQIHPCKACFSTAPALCHWPCSCYPNHALGQINDWMAEIYPMWVAAHGIMIVTPVHWYQAPTALKSMMDRLVCADGGNPDPTTTQGKDAARAKRLELDGWPYPRHLEGRRFSVVVHGDSAGTENLRRALVDWLTDMYLVPAGSAAQLDRYVGYYRPYATSHADLDEDTALFEEVGNAARALVEAVARYRAGENPVGARLHDARPR